jgi:segregation and condensation protein A
LSYQIKLDKFEGPFDLLLHLIKKDEIDIYDIPVAKITEEYLKYIKLMQNMNLEVAGEFLVVAGTLLYIKSRLLLPSMNDAEDEGSLKDEEDDPRRELVRQLLEYKRFKEAARLLETQELKQKDIFYRVNETQQKDTEQNLEVSLFELIDAFKKVLGSTKKSQTKEIIQEEVSVEEKIEEIVLKLKDKGYLDFNELFTPVSTKMVLIATFLALLELMKQKQVRVMQTKLFSVIRIYKVVEVCPPELSEEKPVEVVEPREEASVA